MGFYYETKEYRDGLNQLKNEYAIAYKKVAAYIHTVNVYGLELEENCLLQVMDDFLTAQKEEKPLNKITGSNLRSFCNRIIKAEAERASYGIVYWLQIIPISFLAYSILILLFTFVFSENKVAWYSIHTITLKGSALLFVVIVALIYGLKRILANVLFHDFILLKILNIVMIIIATFIANEILEQGDKFVPISLQLSIPFFITLNALAVIASIGCIRYLNKRKIIYKIIPEEIITDEIDKRICPICSKKHDCDYPVCPYCKHVYEEFLNVIN